MNNQSNKNVDVAVLCLFFNRPQQFGQVFEQIRLAKPSRLYLYQDGPRNENDMPGILACREIASQIDWDCEVHTLYQEQNYGCDPSEYMSQKWAFSLEDKCIFLEDDDVPSLDFFRFCKEMLDLYEFDTRISMISGINYEEITEYCPYDYFFTSDAAIWGWASWRRVFNQWDNKYTFLERNYEMNLAKQNIQSKNLRRTLIDITKKHKATGKEFYESILFMNQLLNSGLAIVPRKNMIHNIGITGDSTHFNGSIKTIAGGLQKLAKMPTYNLNFPLKHPSYVIEDFSYNIRINKILNRNSRIRGVLTSIVVLLKRIRHGEFNTILKSIKKRL